MNAVDDAAVDGPNKALLESALAHQRMRWRSGQRELAEKILDERPALRGDRNAMLDLIYNEILLRREREEPPTLAEYESRFPSLAADLGWLLEVDAAFESVELASVYPESGERMTSTLRHSVRAIPARPGADVVRDTIPPLHRQLAASSSARGSAELQSLLQRRLRFVSILVTLMYLQSWRQLRSVWHIDQWRYYRVHMAIVAAVWMVAAAAAVYFLLRRKPTSMTYLRWIEAALFAGPIIQLTCVLGDLTWLQGDLLKAFQDPHARSGHFFNSMALFYFPSITCYGILIPNTGRRCLIVTLLVGLLPLALLMIGLPWTPDVWIHYRGPFLEGLFWLTMWMGLGVACASYGCHRINVLEREALNARRLGQYRLRDRLGRGGMGEVYLAEHMLLKQPCAVKIIRPERAGDPGALERFQREVQSMARLKHFNTVTIFDYGMAADGTFYYAMEYLPGFNLEEMVRRFGPLPPARVRHLLVQACAALREAHAMGLIHRDIKPANLIVCERGGVHDVVKVLDFGLVRDVGTGDGHALTADGVVAGTPAYMSPEQAGSRGDLDERSDVYSLGAVAYFALTGQPPFGDRSQVQVLAAHLYETPRPPVNLRSEVTADFSELVMRTLAKRPEERFSDVTRLATALAGLRLDEWTQSDAHAWWDQHGDRPRDLLTNNSNHSHQLS